MSGSINFNFPTKVALQASPLAEAWLVIKWKLENLSEEIPIKKDDLFPIALGRFDKIVRSKYPFRTELPQAQMPLEMTPYLTRFQFRRGGINGWPLLQIGPGIATVNFHSDYSWTEFKKEALYLRKSVIEAYKEKSLLLDSLSLIYRNTIPFNYSEQNLNQFLQQKLNTKILYPDQIPGVVSSKEGADNLNLTTSFRLSYPAGNEGVVRIATAKKKEQNSEVEQVVFDFEVNNKTNLLELTNVDSFKEWLSQSHSVCHEWFMSLVQGDLFNEYKQVNSHE